VTPAAFQKEISRRQVGEQLGELGQARPKHRIDWIAMVRIAQGYRDKDESADRQQVEAVLRARPEGGWMADAAIDATWLSNLWPIPATR
jgi:hypothetical protein